MKNFNYLKIIILLIHIFYIKLSESKKDLLNDIIIFENTNGDIYLDYFDSILVFGTSLSNEEDRIFYGLETYIEEKYIFKDNGEYIPFINKNINRTENKKILNAKMRLCYYDYNFFIILIGTDDSYIEIFNTDYFLNDLNLYSNSDFFPQNTINKGISPLLYDISDDLILISSLNYNDDTTNFFISANKFDITINESIFTYTLNYNRSFYNIKGEYIDCFACSLNSLELLFSCFYLDSDNNYRINIIENTDTDFIEKSNTIIGNLSSPIDGEFYFLKGISVENEYMETGDFSYAFWGFK